MALTKLKEYPWLTMAMTAYDCKRLRSCTACPKSGPVPSISKHYQAFYNILQGMSQERACPKNEPVPSIFEGMIGYDRACPKSGPVPKIS